MLIISKKNILNLSLLLEKVKIKAKFFKPLSMADWDLLTPGIGLTSIGIVGVFISLSGIAKTFLDGMHAVSLLTLLIGLLFLTPGIFKDGFPSSRKAKLGSFITLGILVIIGLVGAVYSSGQTPTIFVYIGILILISVTAAAVILGIYRNSSKVKIYLASFVVSVIIGIISFSTVGIQLQNPEAESQEKKADTTANLEPVTDIDITKLATVNILAGSSAQGNPDFDPDQLVVQKDYVGILWINQDNVPHTVTSLKDDGKSFDSSIIMGNANYTLLLSDLKEKEYDYFCTIHPYMKAKFQIE
jgi:plastocyanin